MYLLAKYGVELTIYYPLEVVDEKNFGTGFTYADGDVTISKDGGNWANIAATTEFAEVDSGKLYKTVVSATEMSAAVIAVKIIDQGTKAFEDQMVIIHTYGHASAQHAFDLDTETVNLDAAYDAAKTASQAGDAMALTSDERTSTAAAVAANASIKKVIQALSGKTVADTSDNTLKVYDTNGSTLLYTITFAEVGTVRTGTPS